MSRPSGVARCCAGSSPTGASRVALDAVVAYLVPRTVAALGVGLVARHRGQPLASFAGQLAADAAATLLVAAFGDFDVRYALGSWGVPVFAYLAGWEGWKALLRWRAFDDADARARASWAEIIAGPWRWVWDLVVVAPPVLAGLAIAADVLVPGQLPLPNAPAPVRCTPALLGPRDTLTIRMTTPHGGELGIGTPANRFLIVVPFAPADTPREQRFEERRELRLAVARVAGRTGPGAMAEPVFQDTGTYYVRVSEPAEISASGTCRVRYVSAAGPAAPSPAAAPTG